MNLEHLIVSESKNMVKKNKKKKKTGSCHEDTDHSCHWKDGSHIWVNFHFSIIEDGNEVLQKFLPPC